MDAERGTREGAGSSAAGADGVVTLVLAPPREVGIAAARVMASRAATVAGQLS